MQEYEASQGNAAKEICNTGESVEETGVVLTEEIIGTESTTQRQEEDFLSVVKENGVLLREIKETFQNRLEYDSVKEKAFDKLYEEMRRQKESSDLLDRAVKPILSDLVLLYDSMKNFEVLLSDWNGLTQEEVVQNFKYLRDELIEILYRQEVTFIDENLSDVFNSKLQKAVKTENAESKDEDFKITNTVRSGFVWKEKVLRHQEVIIKRFVNKS